MFQSRASRYLFCATILLVILSITLQACSEERIARVLCPLPYLEMGTEPWCDNDKMIRSESETVRRSAIRLCEGRVPQWEVAWRDCADWVQGNDEAREGGHRWKFYPLSPPAHECRNLTDKVVEGRVPTELKLSCTRVLRWWSATYRDAAVEGYAHKLSLKDEQKLQVWMDEYMNPAEK